MQGKNSKTHPFGRDVNGVVCDGFMVVNRVISRYYAMYRRGLSDFLLGDF